MYNDALINLLEKFFEMKKSECKETIGVYRRFLMRQESVQRFLQLAEVCHGTVLRVCTRLICGGALYLGGGGGQGDTSQSEAGS